MWGQTAESAEPASRRAPMSQVPSTLLAGGNQSRAGPVRTSTVHGSEYSIPLDRSSDVEPLSEMKAQSAIIRIFESQSQTSLPPLTCSEHFSHAPQSPLSFFLFVVCAHPLTAHIHTIDRAPGGGQ